VSEREQKESRVSSVLPEDGQVSLELQAVRSILGFVGFSADDVMDVLGEASHEGLISEFGWFRAITHMCDLNRVIAEEDEDRRDEAMLFAGKIFDGLAGLYPPLRSASGERVVSYSLLLAAVTILCDCPPEEKLLTAFMVLSDSVVGPPCDPAVGDLEGVVSLASLSNVTDFFRGVFAVLHAVSPTVQDITHKVGVSPDDMASVAMQSAVAQSGIVIVTERGLDVEQFNALAWVCIEM